MADTALGINTTYDLLLGGTTQGMDIDKLSKDQLMQMIDASTKVRNKALALIVGQLSLPTVNRGDLIGQHNDVGDWREATEFTKGERVRTSGVTGVGFPVYKFAKRAGWTRDYLAKASNQEILATYLQIMNAHKSANYKAALRALFDDSAAYRTWNDDLFKEDGDVRVFPLVAGKSDFTPPPFGSNTFLGTHDHYNTFGTPLDETDLTLLADEIREHGYGVDPSAGGMGGQIVVWINSAQQSTVAAFTNHMDLADSNVLVSVLTDVVREQGSVNLDTYLGYNKAARCWIRVVDYVPSSYQIAFATTTLSDDQLNRFAPLRRRIPAQANLQGIRRIQESQYPLVDSYWEDWFGYGVGNRISAAINYIHASTYAVPTIAVA